MNNKGFTIIEMLIVLAVAAIIGTVAIVSYQGSVQKTYRSEAQSELMKGIQDMERLYTVNDSYASATVNNIFGGEYLPDSSNRRYQLSISNQSDKKGASNGLLGDTLPSKNTAAGFICLTLACLQSQIQ